MPRTPTASALVVAFMTMLAASRSAVGFNPQPEPPGDRWRVEGFVDMTALTSVPTGTEQPFGVDPALIGDGLVDFHARLIARFDAPTNAFTNKPVDGSYTPTVQFFDLRVGDTEWTRDMLVGDELQFELAGGVVTGLVGVVTPTVVWHPDLAFFAPSSPGTWTAIDERNGVSLGTISGEYTLRDGAVPEPGALWLLVAAGMLFAVRRRQR